MKFRDAINSALDEALAADETVIILGEDIGDRQGGGVMTATQGLSTKYGDQRVRTTPISEQAIMGAAIGAALGGMKPVAEIMISNFLGVAMDQITNHAAKLRYMSGGQTPVPITVRTMTGAAGSFGAQHSEMAAETWLAHVPGLKIISPSNPTDAKTLLKACIFDEDPCIFFEHIALYFAPEGPDVEELPLGKAAVRRSGSDVTLIAHSRSVLNALQAATILEAEGISVEVIDLRTIVPLDIETVLSSVAKTRRAVIAHETVGPFGVGAEIAFQIYEQLHSELLAPILRATSLTSPVPFSPPLEAAYLVGVEGVLRAVRQLVGADVSAQRAGTAAGVA